MYKIEPRGNYFAIEKNSWHINEPTSASGLHHYIFIWHGATFFPKKKLVDIINKNYIKKPEYLHWNWKIGKLESNSRFSIVNINDRKALNYLKTADNPYPKKDLYTNNNSVSIIIKRNWAEHLEGRGH